MDHAHAETQQHPLSIYLWIWGLLFVLSVCSYMVDYLDFEGFLRWFLISAFMLLKAGLIVAVFMHMMWERLAIRTAVLVPTGVLLVLMTLMALEANYTFVSRLRFFFN
jgi:cytochrome c oxidase subunit IV